MIEDETRQVAKKVQAGLSNFFTSSCPTEGRIRSDHLTFLRPHVLNIHGVLDAYSTTGPVYTIHCMDSEFEYPYPLIHHQSVEGVARGQGARTYDT